jgi:hypothetical protein
MANNNFDIIAFNGVTGECSTTSDVDLDNWTQRLKENPFDSLEDIRQEHESWLAELEGLAVEAIATNDWADFYAHVVNFQNENDLHDEAFISDLQSTLMNWRLPALTLNPTTRKKSFGLNP